MITVVFGTRPELIKIAPLIHKLKTLKIRFTLINTGQHKEMLVPLEKWFGLEPDYKLDIMQSGQTLNQIIHKSILALSDLFEKIRPSIVLVQGDTTTAFTAALAAFNLKLKVGHVEAGLRTGNLYNPFPEEANRRLISQVATFHFAPTNLNRDNLIANGIDPKAIHITGNTVIDALNYTVSKVGHSTGIIKNKILIERLEENNGRVIAITGHRRENIGEGFENIFKAISILAEKYPNDLFIYPVHPNPLVKNAAEELLSDHDNILLLPPLDYPEFVALMTDSYLIISDSGGVQEEAPSLGIPVLVTRKTTERVEAVESGTVKLVGTEYEQIVQEASHLMDDQKAYERMSSVANPYGDGHASEKIVEVIIDLN